MLTDTVSTTDNNSGCSRFPGWYDQRSAAEILYDFAKFSTTEDFYSLAKLTTAEGI